MENAPVTWLGMTSLSPFKGADGVGEKNSRGKTQFGSLVDSRKVSSPAVAVEVLRTLFGASWRHPQRVERDLGLFPSNNFGFWIAGPTGEPRLRIASRCCMRAHSR